MYLYTILKILPFFAFSNIFLTLLRQCQKLRSLLRGTLQVNEFSPNTLHYVAATLD